MQMSPKTRHSMADLHTNVAREPTLDDAVHQYAGPVSLAPRDDDYFWQQHLQELAEWDAEFERQTGKALWRRVI